MPSAQKLAVWYQQVAQLLQAGIPLPRALRECAGVTPKGRSGLAQSLESGETLSTALGMQARWLPAEDRIALAFAGQCGRLPETFTRLSERRLRQSDTRKRILAATIYPLLILHLAVLGGAVPGMVDPQAGLAWKGSAYAAHVLPPLALIWGLAFAGVLLTRVPNPIIPLVAAALPGFRRYMRYQSLADFCYGLGHFLTAGLTIEQSWRAAGEVTRRSDLKKAAARMVDWIGQGQAPSAHMDAVACFPQLFQQQYRGGEMTGQLDRDLLWLGQHYQNMANDGLRFATFFYPLLVFLLAAAYIASGIFRIYSGYLDILGGLLG